MTTLPASISRRTRSGSIDAIRARPYWPSVVIPACGPLRLMAATPSAWSAIETSVALWCSPVASSMSSSRSSGWSVMAAARPSNSSVVSPIAETMTTRFEPLARSRPIRRATRRILSASARLEPPNFWMTSGAAGIDAFYRRGLPLPDPRSRHRRGGGIRRTAVGCGELPSRYLRMCFDLDSRPPIAPIAGGALDSTELTLEADDGNRFRAFRARATTPIGAGIVILPDVRGLHPFYEELALRFAENGVDALALDYFGRTAGLTTRDDAFEYQPHVGQMTWAGVSADVRAAAGNLRMDNERRVDALFTTGFGRGGGRAFVTSAVGLERAGAIGVCGGRVGPRGGERPAAGGGAGGGG